MVRVFGHYIPRAILSLVVIEFLVLILAFYLGIAGYNYLTGNPEFIDDFAVYFPRSLVFAIVISSAMTAMGLYSPYLRDGNWGVIVKIGASLCFGLLFLVLLFYLFPDLFVGRGAMAISLLVTAMVFVGVRLVFMNYFDIDVLKRRILVLGTGRQAAAISQLLRRKSDRRGILIVGFVRFRREAPAVIEDIIEHDRPLRELAARHRADCLVLAVDERRNTFPVHEIVDCRMHGIEILDLMSLVERYSRKILLDALHPSWLIFSQGFRQGFIRDIEKRSFDIAASLVILALAWPIMFAATAAILAEGRGRGPVFYRQKRVGEHGCVFDVLKFRSMTVDAEAGGAVQWARKGDARITRVGGVLRKFRIDELPQLINVLRGEMSFVGPRPERPEFVEELARKIPYYNDRHRVKPGITGWAQICYPYGASERDAEEKLQYDLYYVKNYSMFLDLIILLQTAQIVLSGKGAR